MTIPTPAEAFAVRIYERQLAPVAIQPRVRTHVVRGAAVKF
jgi:hypothetical protein